VQAKQHLRRDIRTARAKRPPGWGDGLLTVVRQAGLVGPGVVTGYRAMPGEPDPSDLLSALRDSGATVLLPRVHGADLQWVPWTETTVFEPGPFGLSEPAGEPIDYNTVASGTVMFIPALAVDHTGRRLGQGGGFFDRLLAKTPRVNAGGPLRVALVHDEEFVATLPDEDHDQSVDAVLTQTRFLRL
jgi:5-formyltetrahydrofolate cyclo-ligase